MKYYALLGVLCSTCAFAQQHGRVEPRPYLRGDLGFAITEDMDVTLDPSFVPATGGNVKMDLDPGSRFSVAGGAMFGDFFGLELETGFMYNEIDSISGFTDVDGWITQVPFLANAMFEIRTKVGLTPFIGGGAGGVGVGLDLDDADSPTVSLDGWESDFVFAWQVFGGLRYEINENLSVGLTDVTRVEAQENDPENRERDHGAQEGHDIPGLFELSSQPGDQDEERKCNEADIDQTEKPFPPIYGRQR